MQWYANALANALGSVSGGNAPNIDYLSDDIYVALVADTYTPDLAAHDFWNDVVANEVTGTGYTANGAILGTKTMTVTAANSWATQWATVTAFLEGDIVRPTVGNGFLYRAVGAGTADVGEPSWPTEIGATVVDNDIVWTCIARSIIQLDAANPSWINSTLTARYAVAYDRTPGTDATRPLLGLFDFGGNQSTTNGTLEVQFSALGMLILLPS